MPDYLSLFANLGLHNYRDCNCYKKHCIPYGCLNIVSINFCNSYHGYTNKNASYYAYLHVSN